MGVPQITVIVAVHQAEKYLHRCLDSIVNQTFSDWDCILVDDGSTDRSGVICDKYAVRDSRFRVIHQANRGVSITRQVGLDAARGEYIIFADSDDWVETEWLEKLHRKMIADNVDMVICDFEHICAEKTAYHKGCGASTDNTDLLAEMVRFGKWGYWGTLWNRLIRRESFSRYQVSFPPDMSFMEDVYVVSKLLTYPIKVSHLPEALYHYDATVNGDSLTKSKNDQYYHSIMVYVNSFSPILSSSRFDEAWYQLKKRVKMNLFSSQGQSRYEFKNVYPEINERLIGEFKPSRWWSRNRGIIMCLRGHPRIGFFLYDVLTKLKRHIRWIKR